MNQHPAFDKKVLVMLFQMLVGWRGNALLALRRGRNLLNGAFFLEAFSLRLHGQRKSGYGFCVLLKTIFAELPPKAST